MLVTLLLLPSAERPLIRTAFLVRSQFLIHSQPERPRVGVGGSSAARPDLPYRVSGAVTRPSHDGLHVDAAARRLLVHLVRRGVAHVRQPHGVGRRRRVRRHHARHHSRRAGREALGRLGREGRRADAARTGGAAGPAVRLAVLAVRVLVAALLALAVLTVRLDVLREVVGAHEALVADGAGEALLARVRAQVPLQLVGPREPLACNGEKTNVNSALLEK